MYTSARVAHARDGRDTRETRDSTLTVQKTQNPELRTSDPASRSHHLQTTDEEDGLEVRTLQIVGASPRDYHDDVSSGLAAWLRIAYCSIMAFDRIQIDPTVCNGKPTIRGLRFTVDFVLKLLGDGYTAVDITREYPELQLEDVYQAARYGAWLASEQTFAGL